MNRFLFAGALLGWFALLGLSLPAATLPPPQLPRIPDRNFRVTDYGAVGDGKTMDTSAFQKALGAVDYAGGGTLTVPAGTFLIQPISLISNLNLHLARGAVLLINDTIAQWSTNAENYQNCISASDAHDLEISGDGTIDGQGATWWKAFRANKAMLRRPFLVCFERCTRVEIVGITLTNSPMFHFVPGHCNDVTVQDVTIFAPAKAPNTDGIDPSGSSFLIEGCTIDTGDDNIAIKPAEPEQNKDFTITRCTFRHGHGMSIGSGTNGGLDSLTVSDCSFENTDAGIRIKTARGRGGLVQNVTYDHLTMTGVHDPVQIVDYYPKWPKTPEEDPAQAITPLTPTFANVTISNLTSTGSPDAGVIWGLPEMPVSGISFINVQISSGKGMKLFHAHGIHFSNSEITAKSGPKLIESDAQGDGLK